MCFINVNDYDKSIKNKLIQNINVVNIINAHIELFVLLKLSCEKSNKGNEFLIHDYFTSIVPSFDIKFKDFQLVYNVLNLKPMFNLNKYNKSDYIGTYLLELMIKNINQKYTKYDKEKFIKVFKAVFDEEKNESQIKFENYIENRIGLGINQKIVQLINS